MNLTRKLQYADAAIRSIAEHDDESASNVLASLQALKKRIDELAKAAVERRNSKKSK